MMRTAWAAAIVAGFVFLGSTAVAQDEADSETLRDQLVEAELDAELIGLERDILRKQLTMLMQQLAQYRAAPNGAIFGGFVGGGGLGGGPGIAPEEARERLKEQTDQLAKMIDESRARYVELARKHRVATARVAELSSKLGKPTSSTVDVETRLRVIEEMLKKLVEAQAKLEKS